MIAATSRASRRISTRRSVELSCQAVRLSDFKLLSSQILDLSAHGLLVPTTGAMPVRIGEDVIVSFEIPGAWIDAEAVVSRIVQGLRPSDDGPAVGLSFVGLPASSRAALAGFLHGRPPPLPRRGPYARRVVRPKHDAFGLGVLRELAMAWRSLGESDDAQA